MLDFKENIKFAHSIQRFFFLKIRETFSDETNIISDFLLLHI